MNPRNRFTGLLVTGLALGALAGSAQAGTKHNDRSDVISRYLASHVTRTAAQRAVLVPDAFERYAAAHPYGTGPFQTTATSAGFQWADYGAGVGTGIGMFLVLVGGLVAVPSRRRHRTQPVVG